MKWFTSIAVASLAAALGFTSVASADVSFYGRVTAGAVHVDNDKDNDDGAWNLGATGIDGAQGRVATRFGFKGSQDLGNGMEAGFQIERELRPNNAIAQRHALVWLSGGWGKLTLGNQGSPYMNARKWDQTFLFGGNWGHGSGYRHEGIGYSMSNGPFSFNVLATGKVESDDATGTFDAGANGITDTGSTDGATETSSDDSVDGWIIHAGYDFGIVSLDVAHQANNKDYDINTAVASAEADEATRATQLNNHLVDGNASRDNTAIGVNGSVGAMDWYLAYQTSELNAGGSGYEDNDITSVGGLVAFDMSEKDRVYAYYVTHSGDRAQYGDTDGDTTGLQLGETLGEDYTETIVGYTRDMGPGLRFIAEYAAHDHDLEGDNAGSDRSRLGLVIRYVF